MRAANVPRILNFSIVRKGSGAFAHDIYNCTLSVSMEIKYNSDTMLVTSVGTPSVYNYITSIMASNVSNPRATATITNSGENVTINGYIDVQAGYTMTFTGQRVYRLRTNEFLS